MQARVDALLDGDERLDSIGESSRRRHLVVALGGGRAFGIASEGVIELRALHVAPTASLLGLRAPALTIERTAVMDGVAVKYTSNEIGPAIVGVVLGNGGYAERILAGAPLRASPELATLAPIVGRAISRRYARHYRGAALHHLRAFDARPSLSSALHGLRAALTGVHLLATGAMVVDAGALTDGRAFPELRAALDRERAPDHEPPPAEPLAAASRDSARAELVRAVELLDDAERTSKLPALTPNEAELDAWLVELRRASL